ncbi:uroporphyrinogen-III synthase [Amphibiibacter pelophylacis]|uniref:Uroporphyrinogen-III synthase n=1 Tax=Amphibiibacter pelophylacis TaxID=1799477 RepID=A0ACC6P2L7_9BURK
MSNEAPLPLVNTRAPHQAAAWDAALKAADLPGVLPVHLPLIDIQPRRPVQWLDAQGQESSAAQEVWSGRRSSGLVGAVLVFVSANAVACFFTPTPVLDAFSQGWPPGAIACATGAATRQALLDHGVPPGALWCPQGEGAGDSEALWAHLQQQRPPDWWQGRPVLVVRGTGGRPWLGQRLSGAGAALCYAQAYSLGEPLWTPQQSLLLAQSAQEPGSVWWLASSAVLEPLAQRLADAGFSPQAVLARSQAWVLHPRQAEAATRLGFGRTHLVSGPTPAALHQAWRDSRAARAAF